MTSYWSTMAASVGYYLNPIASYFSAEDETSLSIKKVLDDLLFLRHHFDIKPSDNEDNGFVVIISSKSPSKAESEQEIAILLNRIELLMDGSKEIFISILPDLSRLLTKLKDNILNAPVKGADLEHILIELRKLLNKEKLPSTHLFSPGTFFLEKSSKFKGGIIHNIQVPLSTLFDPEKDFTVDNVTYNNFIADAVVYYDRCFSNGVVIFDKPIEEVNGQCVHKSIMDEIAAVSLAFFGKEYTQQAMKYLMSTPAVFFYECIEKLFLNDGVNLPVRGVCQELELELLGEKKLLVRHNIAFKFDLAIKRNHELPDMHFVKYLWGTRETLFKPRDEVLTDDCLVDVKFIFSPFVMSKEHYRAGEGNRIKSYSF